MRKHTILTDNRHFHHSGTRLRRRQRNTASIPLLFPRGTLFGVDLLFSLGLRILNGNILRMRVSSRSLTPTARTSQSFEVQTISGSVTTHSASKPVGSIKQSGSLIPKYLMKIPRQICVFFQRPAFHECEDLQHLADPYDEDEADLLYSMKVEYIFKNFTSGALGHFSGSLSIHVGRSLRLPVVSESNHRYHFPTCSLWDVPTSQLRENLIYDQVRRIIGALESAHFCHDVSMEFINTGSILIRPGNIIEAHFSHAMHQRVVEGVMEHATEWYDWEFLQTFVKFTPQSEADCWRCSYSSLR
jgi:hypothetical protein